MASRILLDSHTWLWMNGAPDRLSSDARELLADAENELFLSAASVWEIAIKVASGKLVLPEEPEPYVLDRVVKNQVTPLSIHHRHALRAAALPAHHRDPFDRMLVAQAQLEELTLMTADKQLELYDVALLWAHRQTSPEPPTSPPPQEDPPR